MKPQLMLFYFLTIATTLLIVFFIVSHNWLAILLTLVGAGLSLGWLFISPVMISEPSSSDLSDQPFKRFLFTERIGKKAKALYPDTKVLPSITIAQAILESDWGRSTLASKYHNYFGIKTQSNNKRDFVLMKTKEVYDGQTTTTITAKFARFSSIDKSIEAHANLLKAGTTDKPDRYQSVIKAKNYKEAAKALYQDGYATDPNYPTSLISLIQEYHLSVYDP